MGLITNLVQGQYQRYPYPDYPLLYRPPLQEGWLSSSAFSRQLLNHFEKQNPRSLFHRGKEDPGGGRILVGGCGTVQPFIFSGWESLRNELHFVDLSSSSLLKAKFRLRLAGFRHYWYAQDLNSFLQSSGPRKFDHIDMYGVLHHLEDPKQCLSLIQDRSASLSTMRLMIYNSVARNKIHLIQNLFSQMRLSLLSHDDISMGRKILKYLQAMPNLKQMFCSMKPALKSKSAVVDTFFHQREIRKSPDWWLDMLKASQFTPLGLFDRYGELDDLMNPLWVFPEMQELRVRCLDRRFENNLELFTMGAGRFSRAARHTNISPLLFWSPFPASWFQFTETKRVSLPHRMLLWHSFLRTLRGQKVPKAWTKKIQTLSDVTLKRLARVGAILPGLFESDHEMMEMLRSPICRFMEPPEVLDSGTYPDALIRLIKTHQSGLPKREFAIRWQVIEKTLEELRQSS